MKTWPHGQIGVEKTKRNQRISLSHQKAAVLFSRNSLWCLSFPENGHSVPQRLTDVHQPLTIEKIMLTWKEVITMIHSLRLNGKFLRMKCFTPLLHQRWTNYPTRKTFIGKIATGHTGFVNLCHNLSKKKSLLIRNSQRKLQENEGFQWIFCSQFLFFFSEVEILRRSNKGKFCILKNIVLSVMIREEKYVFCNYIFF